jgi:hypothetical protein
MRFPWTGRIACGLCALLLLTACGGGGGGTPSTGMPPPSGGGNPPGGQLPTFGATITPLVFTAPIPNRTPASQRIPVTISGNTSGKLYVVARDSDPSVVRTTVSAVDQSGANPTVDVFVDPAPAPTLLQGVSSRTATITLTACVRDDTCQTGQLPGSPQTVNVTYTINSAVQGDLLGPRVITTGTTGSVYLRGRGLSTTTQVSFRNTAATAVSAFDNDTEVLATYPALTAGTYPVTINAGAIAFSASLVVVPATNYSATQLTYPSPPQEIGGVLYDPQRQALYVAARYANSQNNTLFKFQFSNGAWQAPLSATVPSLQDVALSADGSKVLALTDNSLVELNADAFASVGMYMPDDELVQSGMAYMQNIAVANDGYAIITTGGANPSNTLLYSSLANTLALVHPRPPVA